MTPQLIRATVLCASIFVLGSHPASAQSAMERATTTAAAAEARTSQGAPEQPTSAKGAVTALPADPGSVVLADTATRQSYLQSMQRYYQYRADGYAYRSRLFEWQLLSSRIIFVAVLALVGAGIYFAAIQFRQAMRAHKVGVAAAAGATPVPDALATQLEISAKGFTVNSSVMGIIILLLSLAFFYLYLVFVYPITDVL
jgi:hypothetical protein